MTEMYEEIPLSERQPDFPVTMQPELHALREVVRSAEEARMGYIHGLPDRERTYDEELKIEKLTREVQTVQVAYAALRFPDDPERTTP